MQILATLWCILSLFGSEFVKVGWDTDQFNMDVKKATLLMLAVIQQGGIAPGGLNFDSKVRRESVDLEDLFIAHIGESLFCRYSFVKALWTHSLAVSVALLPLLLTKLWQAWSKSVMQLLIRTNICSLAANTCVREIGAKIEQGSTSFEELEQFAIEEGEPKSISGKQEMFEVMFSSYM